MNSRRRMLMLAAVIVILVGGVGSYLATRVRPTIDPALDQQATPDSTVPTTTIAASEELVLFCGNCHRVPAPEFFPRNNWYQEVQRGFNFYTVSGRQDLVVPEVNSVVTWYRSHAPEKLASSEPLPTSSRDTAFRKEPLTDATFAPMVASLNWEPAAAPWPALRFSDMEVGEIAGAEVGPTAKMTNIATGSHVAGTKIVDVDQDGINDLLMCELGSKPPGDHELGKLRYLPGGSAGQEPIALLEHIGRIADASAADFDLDGDPDFVVAEFGWLKTGSILVLENIREPEFRGQQLGVEDFAQHRIDSRHGTIHVHVTDLNHDQRPDFVALISQEFETVEAFINEGDFKFRREVLMEPQDPAYGSCGIELADLDHDGDVDIVYCNGDTLDSHLIKPYHGVHLLLNEGRFPFSMQRLLNLPGASDSAVVDLDGDGDLDIAVSAYLPKNLLSQVPAGTYDSLCWLEQTSPLHFQPHAIETGTIGHLGLAAGDFDANGTIDLAVGDSPGNGWGSIWWNTHRQKHGVSTGQDPMFPPQ